VDEVDADTIDFRFEVRKADIFSGESRFVFCYGTLD
jgi:hypothetical protein